MVVGVVVGRLLPWGAPGVPIGSAASGPGGGARLLGKRAGAGAPDGVGMPWGLGLQQGTLAQLKGEETLCDGGAGGQALLDDVGMAGGRCSWH